MRNLLSPLPAAKFDAYHASHLMWRAGFGCTWSQAEQIARQGLGKSVTKLVDLPPLTANQKAIPEFAKLPEEPQSEFYKRTKALPQDERNQERNDRRKSQEEATEQLKYWWLTKMLNSPDPLREKMTLFWHSHFATSFEDKIEMVYPLWQQNMLYRENALAPFQVLLEKVTRDPAMLVWLDNASSRKGKPNENFARELMELFSTGVNQYTEEDVAESARALTGMSVNRDDWSYVFKENHHDDGTKKFLGWTGDFAGADIVRIICQQEATPRFIARKLLEFFLYENPEEELVDEATELFKSYSLGIEPFLASLFKSRIFYSEEARHRMIKSPVMLMLGALKTMQVELPDQEVALPALKVMGQDLFYPPDVNGWPGGTTWINSNTLLIRYNFSNFLIYGVSPENFRVFEREKGQLSAERRDFIEAQRSEHAVDWSPKEQLIAKDLDHGPLNVNRLTDHYVRSFLQRKISPQMRKQYVDFCATDAAGGRSDLDLRSDHFDERIKGLVHLIMSSPDYQLC